MSDLFISYAREDRPRAETLARVLTRCGWSVWWDRRIPLGKTFAQVIEEQIRTAKCVIVLWSRAAVTSDWVHNEAAEGQQRGILAPVFIEDVQIPFEFRRIQAGRLVDWNGESDSIEFSELLEAIERIIGRKGSPAGEPTTVEKGKSQPEVDSQAGEKHGQTEGPRLEHTAPQLVASFFPLAKEEQSVWLQWLLATTLVGAVVGAVGGGGPVDGVMVGVVSGAAQWFVLKQKFDQSWILASALGGAVGEVVGVGGPVVGVMVGAVSGAAQWFVLKQKFDQSGWWILASALSGAVGGAVGGARGGAVVGAVGGAVGGAAGGTITGTVLIWLFRHPISKT